MERGGTFENGGKVLVTVAPIDHYLSNISSPEVGEAPRPLSNGNRLFVIKDNKTIGQKLIIFMSEFLGTAILLLIGCLGCVEGLAGNSHLQICLTFGLAVMVSIQIFGHISGGHINPIITIAAAILGTLPLVDVPIYFFAQLFGALAGYATLMAATPHRFITGKVIANHTIATPVGLCSPYVNPLVTPFQGFLIEFLISLILVWVACGVWHPRNADKHDSVPIKFGFAIAVLAVIGGGFSGGNMNPVRSFAPALLNGDWDNHWLYWIGPILAAFVGAGSYRALFWPTKTPSHDDKSPEGVPLQ